MQLLCNYNGFTFVDKCEDELVLVDEEDDDEIKCKVKMKSEWGGAGARSIQYLLAFRANFAIVPIHSV